MAKIITVVYNREDASEVVDVRVTDQTQFKDLLKTGSAIKQAIDFARTKDPITLLQQPAQKGRFILDIEKSTRLTAEEKAKFIDLLASSGPLDVSTFGIGDKPAAIVPVKVVTPTPTKKSLVIVFVDP